MKHDFSRLVLAWLCFVTLASSAGPAAAQDAGADDVTMLRMRDGSIHWGRIQAHDPDGITFVRLDDGGVARIAFPLLDPEYSDELRSRYGYVDLTNEELLIEADRIALVDGTEVVGRIVDKTEDAVIVKQSGATIPVPKNRIAGASTTIQVPALQLYTKEELYQQELALRDPASAQSQFDLARFCERILDFAHAAEHYGKALALDASFRPKDVKPALDRATEKAKAQDQIDYLAEIDLLVARNQFDQALTRAQAFKEKFQNSPLLADAKRKVDRVIAARDRDLSDRVVRLWYSLASRLARGASSKSLDEVLAYLDGAMQKEVAEGVAKELRRVSKESTPELVRKMWAARKKMRWNRASYGYGTWLLGRERALRGADGQVAEKKQVTGEKDQQRAALEEKIKRFLENQEVARRSKTAAEQAEDTQGFWEEFEPASRAQWILAYYAEYSGDMEVAPKPALSACRECGGTGTRVMSVAGSNVSRSMIGKAVIEQTIECPTCRGLGIVRRILYR